MEVRLGSAHGFEAYVDAERVLRRRPLLGERTLELHIPDTYTLMEAISAVIAPGQGAWANQSLIDPETGEPHLPLWVESDVEALAIVLASTFGGIPTSCPDGWGVIPDDDTPDVPVSFPNDVNDPIAEG